MQIMDSIKKTINAVSTFCTASCIHCYLVVNKQTLTMAIPKPWQFTNHGSSQTMAVHKPWQFLNHGNSQTMAVHKPWQFTNHGNSHTMAIHKEMSGLYLGGLHTGLTSTVI